MLKIETNRATLWDKQTGLVEDLPVSANEHFGLAVNNKSRKGKAKDAEPVDHALIFVCGKSEAKLQGSDNKDGKDDGDGVVGVWSLREGVVGVVNENNVLEYRNCNSINGVAKTRPLYIEPLDVYRRSGELLIDKSGASTSFAVQRLIEKSTVAMWTTERGEVEGFRQQRWQG
mmetsp:Transcript_102394/g.294779  ORF Transcript_102394/g.294779 Transcript_102394/m.294779 type:complete len:173 (+) Transcript_102394:401-919(+)